MGTDIGILRAAPGHPVTAAVLITDPSDALLIAHPAKDGAPWQLPGGIVEQYESPAAAVRRQTREEIGLDLDISEHDLFAVEWLQATRPGRRDRFALLFAFPALLPSASERITSRGTELHAWRWAGRGEAGTLLHPAIAARIVGPLQLPGATIYREVRHEGPS